MIKILLIPLIAGVGAQLLKVIYNSRSISDALKQFVSYGGMPSSHTAFVTSLTAVVYLSEGIASPLFVVVLIYAFLTVRDAVGVRQILSQQAKIINQFIKVSDNKELINIPSLEERIGHTPFEAFVGAVWGIGFSLTFWFLF